MSVLALAGGVGGAKLCLGLARVLSPDDLQIVVNTGDDEEFYGLHVSPDLDTVMYTLAGLANPYTGWGITGETFATLEHLGKLGEDTWFGLGDRDMATHIVRTNMLRQGKSLSEVTSRLYRSLGVEHPVAPMTDDRVRTKAVTNIGTLEFQTYFVKHRCEPVVRDLVFDGSGSASMSEAFSKALSDRSVLVYCPSNPLLSMAPILAVPGVESAIKSFSGVTIAVSPIVGGKALRGPAAKLLEELGEDVSCVGVARRYSGICDVFILDDLDRHHADEIRSLGMVPVVVDTIMNTEQDKIDLARIVLEVAGVAHAR
ncbi:2-phospho-L-lactate transferase [Geodia barretti]|uniref:2-phospho-L-lactate transferase n=1 Tax=Geodia barretti TaxID=519541 RepID=A0AA35RLV5_GEOBA|nr:2-phospho-L-lactate transferase [Geodia barretti]